MAELDDIALCGIVSTLVKDAEKYRDERSDERLKAMAFFDGEADEMQKYIPADDGRSQVVSRDVRSAIKKVLPSIYRTILGNDQIVEYQPVGEGDDDMASQATDYVNYVVVPECGARQAIEDAINDAVRLRNGIIKWWQEEITDVKVSLHTGLDEMGFAQLVEGDDVEVLEHSERVETVEIEGQAIPIPTHDVKIKRRVTNSKPALSAIPLENWLIHPDAIRLEDSPILGEKCQLRRSDLVKMGYDKEKIWLIPASGADNTEQEAEADARRRDIEQNEDAPQRALDEIDYYDLLVRVDKDGDGIAELRRMVFAGGIKEECLLVDTEWDEVNYADIVSERRPHQWEGNSVSDDVMEIQTIKTVLLRQTLDNIYWQNNLQPIVEEGAIVNPEAVLNPKFGLPIRRAQGSSEKAVQYNIVPLVADKSFTMLGYLDEETTDRTGISDASSGMAPDALQNMTAKATALVEQAGIGQTEMMVRCIANSLKPVFRGLLKLIIQHQDKPRTVRLRDEWVTFDPRTWNADMDAVVNVGLGAGTRERDMMAMMQVIGLQERILASMGPAVGMQYVSPQNVYNAVAKLTEAAGLKTVGLYFTEPDPEAIQKAIQSQSQQPSPEEIKAKAAMELEQVRAQTKMQVEQAKLQAKREEYAIKSQSDASKEAAQMEADLATKLQEIEAEAVARMEEAVLRAETDREQQAVDLQREAMKQDTEFAWMDVQERISDKKIIADVQRAQMAEAGKALDRSRMPDGNRQGRSGK